MISCATKLKTAINLFCHQYQENNNDLLSERDWQDLGKLGDFLRFFHDATLATEGHSATLDKILPPMDFLLEQFETAKQNYADDLFMSPCMLMPIIDEREIWDRSKADIMIKIINFLQIAWLLLSIAARRIQNLAIATMELGAVSNATSSLAILFVWMQKPTDVVTSILIHIETSTAEILIAAGDAAKEPYVMTPLDFVDNIGPSWSNVMTFMNIPAGPIERPLARFTNDRFPHLRGTRQLILIVVTLFTDGIHLCGWNYRFPTAGEQIAWRIVTMVMFVTATIFWFAELVAVCRRDQLPELWYCKFFTPQKLAALLEERSKQPEEPPLTPEEFPKAWECGASGTVFGLYLIARAFTVIEMFVGLRRLPTSAFAYVNWTTFLPHW